MNLARLILNQLIINQYIKAIGDNTQIRLKVKIKRYDCGPNGTAKALENALTK